MSRIFGTNDPIALEERKFPFFQISIWKGSKKQDCIYTDKRTGQQKKGQKYGNDLGLEFRIELSTTNRKNNSSSSLVKSQQIGSIKDILKQSYKAKEDKNGSLYVDYLNIIPYCNDPNISFFSALATYKNNKPQWFCDKKTIHTKFIGDRGRPVKVKEPCHAKSIYEDCSKGCKEFGSFYFELLELRMLELTRICRLQVSSVEDIVNISRFLDKTKKELGAIRKSPFYSTRTRNFIVYRLSRVAKQNSFKKVNHPVFLELHPLWANEYHSFLLAQQIQSLGLNVPRKVLAEIYGADLIEPEDIQTIEVSSNELQVTSNEKENVTREARGWGDFNKLQSTVENKISSQKSPPYPPPRASHDGAYELPTQVRQTAPPLGNAPRPKGYSILDTQNEWKPSRLDIEEVRSLWRENNWSQEELLLMLRSRFGIQEIKEIQTFNQEQFEQFKEALKC